MRCFQLKAMRTKKQLALSIILLLLVFFHSDITFAGPYLDSAHGDTSSGVNRSSTASLGYTRANCGHCHEQHASIGGSEPAPVSGNPSPFALFSDNFSNDATGPYDPADNFCFYCHVSVGAVQTEGGIINRQYSNTFGCSNSLGASSIIDAFNLRSYHNLEDIQGFAASNFTFFESSSNPCVACHNPHLARRNREYPSDPDYTAISKPTDHENLWGTVDTMGSIYNNSYEPLFCNDSHIDREPAASSDAVQGRANTPDYVGFCTDCHTPTATIYSNTLGRNLRKIDWGNGGEKHGVQLTDGHDFQASGHIITPRIGGGGLVQPPYSANDVGSDYVLSCMDCHEPHGSSNIMLLRSRVNGGELDISITAPDVKIGMANSAIDDIGYLCLRCHYDDKAGKEAGLLGSFNQTVDNHWRYVHHADATGYDAPYGGSLTGTCGNLNCHSWSGGGMARPLCSDCHFHGSVINITVGSQTGSTRKTF